MSEQVKEGFTIVSSRLANGIPFAGFFNGFIAGLTVILFSQDGLYSTIAEIILAGVLTGIVTISVIDHIRNINDIVLFRLFFFITIAVLMLVCSSILIIVLVENLINATAGAIVGAYGRAVMVGVISGATVTIICDTTVATTLVRVAENYTHILLIASVLFQGLFGIYNIISIIAATAGAFLGAALCACIIELCISEDDISDHDMVIVVCSAAAFGASIGASIGALTGIVSGAIIGSFVGATISETDSINAGLLKLLIPTEPYCNSISIRLITLSMRAALKILGLTANIINKIITSKRRAVFRVVGAIIGAAIGAYAGVIGGACIGVIIVGFTIGIFFMGGALFLEPIFSPFHRQRQVVPVSKLIDIVVLFIFASIIGIVILSTVCTWASSYFITSTLMGTFGPYVSYFIGNVIALRETITGNANIASSGFNGGLIGGIIAGIYRTKAANDLRDNEFEVYALGAIGAITGCITARLDEAIGNALLTKF